MTHTNTHKTQEREYTTEADEARGLFHVKVNTAHQTREANLNMALNVNRTFLLMTTSKSVQDTLKSGDLIHGVAHKIAPRTIIAHIQLAQPSL